MRDIVDAGPPALCSASSMPLQAVVCEHNHFVIRERVVGEDLRL
jgi:hypothetical protein